LRKEKMKALEIADVLGNKVQLKITQWENHILAQHPEMKDYLLEIEQTIKSPDCILASAVIPHAKLFYRCYLGRGKYSGCYIEVVVYYNTIPAQVKTAFFTNRMRGGDILWIKSRL
jgi:hypothetical protein